MMRLRVPELLEERGWTAYELSKKSNGRISMSAAYRFVNGDWKCVSGEMLDALCDVFGLTDTGRLFERTDKRSTRKGR
jgi:hypothetical protein